jgi:hypothetical protein
MGPENGFTPVDITRCDIEAARSSNGGLCWLANTV